MTKLLYDVCEWWYEGLRASPEWVRIVVVALMFVGLWVVFTRPVLKEQRKKIRWLGYGVAGVDVVFMTYLSVWTWHFLGVPWATRALVPIKGQEPTEVVNWYVTSRENWFFEDARVFRYLEEIDPNWAKHEDAWRLLPGVLRGTTEPDKIYAPEMLAELKRRYGSDFSAKLVAKFPADWSRYVEAKAVLREARGKLAEKEQQVERLQLASLYGPAGRELTGDLIRAWVETKGEETLYAKTLEAVDAEWAQGPAAAGQMAFLEESTRGEDRERAVRSLTILEAMGPKARRALGGLVRLHVTAGETREDVGRALRAIDPKWSASAEVASELPFLLEKLRSANGSEVRRTLETLAAMGERARDGIGALVQRSVDAGVEVAEVQGILAQIAGRWEESAAAVGEVSFLAEAARGADGEKAGRSLAMLAKIGPGARAALGRLIRLHVTAMENQEVIARSLRSIDAQWEASAGALNELPFLREKVRSEVALEAERSLEVLGRMGKRARPALPDLIRRRVETAELGELNDQVLGRIDPAWGRSAEATVLVPWLLEQAGSEEAARARRSLETFGRMGASAQSALGSLIRLGVMSGTNRELLWATLAAIDARWAGSEPMVALIPWFVEFAGSDDVERAARGLEMLGQLGAVARVTIGELVRVAVEAKVELGRVNATLTRIDPQWEQTSGAMAQLGLLTKSATGGDVERARRSLTIMAKMGRSSRGALGELIRLYVTTDTNREQLGATLAAIDARWAGSAEAVGQREWLENEETEAWYSGDEAKRGRAEVVLRRVVGEWKPDRRAKEGRMYRLNMAEGIRVELGWIAPGEFLQGSPGSESGREGDEGPQRQVKMTKGYWLGKTEVTQGEWEAVMGGNPSGHKLGKNYPVENVSWTEVMEYCRKVTERARAAGRLPVGYEYTLPSEAQWEYACRAGTMGAYAGELDQGGWYGGNSGGKTHPVGEKGANAWGLHDMHGNVWEWCVDWYEGKYPGGSLTDPTGPKSGSYRVNRGGGWWNDAALCRSANRYGDSPGIRYDNLGFRLALSAVR